MGKDTFNYTYSAEQQEEIKNIRKKYVEEEDAMERLRRLDGSVYKKGTSASIAVGVVGTLLLGVGMSCAMVWQGFWFIPGIIIGVIGMAVIALAYPLYQRVIKKERKKIAPEIIRLTDELIK